MAKRYLKTYAETLVDNNKDLSDYFGMIGTAVEKRGGGEEAFTSFRTEVSQNMMGISPERIALMEQYFSAYHIYHAWQKEKTTYHVTDMDDTAEDTASNDRNLFFDVHETESPYNGIFLEENDLFAVYKDGKLGVTSLTGEGASEEEKALLLAVQKLLSRIPDAELCPEKTVSREKRKGKQISVCMPAYWEL